MNQSSVVPAERSSLRRRRIYAVLAGGLVLGVGAAVTLAAWNDSEFAKSTFTAGTFTFQGSTDGTTFADHASAAGAASLTFATNPTDLSPNDVVYAPYSLKVTGAAATVTPVAPVVTGTLSGSLTFAAVQITGTTCDASTFAGGTAVPTAFADGVQVNLCLQTTVGALTDAQQGATANVVWQWDAVSQ